jgi:hypothetical protein
VQKNISAISPSPSLSRSLARSVGRSVGRTDDVYLGVGAPEVPPALGAEEEKRDIVGGCRGKEGEREVNCTERERETERQRERECAFVGIQYARESSLTASTGLPECQQYPRHATLTVFIPGAQCRGARQFFSLYLHLPAPATHLPPGTGSGRITTGFHNLSQAHRGIF